jgi:type VI secretion system secreted protein VgrG
MLDVFTIHSPALPNGTRVVGFRGAEGISRLYVFEIHVTLASDEADSFDLATVVGAKAALVLDRQDGRGPFAFHGILSEAALVHHEPDGRALVRAVLVPRLWRLTQTHHCRIFTQQSIPDILKKTLEDGGLTATDYSFRLTDNYPPEEHVCQYRESHFDFLSRWMEREGLYYWFEQGDDGEKVVIADKKSAHEDLAPAPVRFFALSGADATARECLETFVCRHRALPASVSFKDHDYTKPALDVSGSAPVSKTGVGEISFHGARFFTPDAGKRLARLRAEELLAREQVFTGSGTAFFLRAGYTFSLQDHPRSSFDAKYLATEVEHHGNQSASTPELRRLTGLALDDVYRVDVTAIPSAVQFRAEQRAPWPRIYGTEHGVVDGEGDSEYAQLDEQGRYLVRFAFDESDLGDGKASTRVRMMQPHGGGVEGWHFPLRKGTEVLFTFLGGDPDRPVIAGVVPNMLTPSPVNRANHTRNVIQTGGRNRLELEDKAGFERITLSTPYSNSMIRMGSPNADHHMIVRSDGPMLQETGQDLDITVHGKLTEEVVGSVEQTYFDSLTTDISTGRKETIWGGGMSQTIVGGWKQKVTGDSDQTTTANYMQTTSANYTHTVGGTYVQLVGGDAVQTASAHMTHTAGGNCVVKAGGTIRIEAPCVKIKSPDVTVDGAKLSYKSSNFIDFQMTKNLACIQSGSFVGISVSSGTLKTDATAYAASFAGVKGENGGVKKTTFGGVFKQIGSDVAQAAIAVKSAGARVLNAAITKIG